LGLFDRSKSGPLSIRSGDASEVWNSIEMVLPLVEFDDKINCTIFCNDGNGSWDFGVLPAPCQQWGPDLFEFRVDLFTWARR
jgi:hypothetical protein